MLAKWRKRVSKAACKKQKTQASAEALDTTNSGSTGLPSSNNSLVGPPTSINDLSNELLTNIVEFVQDPEVLDYKPWDSASLHALCLTSKLFNVVTTPILYQTIDLRYRRIFLITPLLRTLAAKPLVARNIQHLSIQPLPGNATYTLAHEKLEHSKIAKLLACFGDLPSELLRSLLKGGWDAENAILLLLIPSLRSLGICIADHLDFYHDPVSALLVMKVMQFAADSYSKSFLRGALGQLQEVRAYPPPGILGLNHNGIHFAANWSFFSDLVKPSTVRQLSLVGLRRIDRNVGGGYWHSRSPNLTSLTLTRTMLSDYLVFELLQRWDPLEHICVRWGDYRSMMRLNELTGPIRRLFPSRLYGVEKGLQVHAASLRSLVLEATAMTMEAVAKRRSSPNLDVHIGSLEYFSVLETLELDDLFVRHKLDRNKRYHHYGSNLLSLDLRGFFPGNLKSFTLHSRLYHGEAYNLLAFLTSFVRQQLEHICVTFVVESLRRSTRLNHYTRLDFYIQQVANGFQLSDPPQLRLQPLENPDLSLLKVEYRGPDLLAKLETLKAEWRGRALQLHQKKYGDDDLLW